MDIVLVRPLQQLDWWGPNSYWLPMRSIALFYEKRWEQQSTHYSWESRPGNPAWVDNIPAEIAQAGGETMKYVLTSICSKIWKTGKRPTTWTQSLVITLPQKGILQLCQNYRTIMIVRPWWRSSQTGSSHKLKISLQETKLACVVC